MRFLFEKFSHALVGALVLSSAFTRLSAAPIPVPNFSFESPDVPFFSDDLGAPWQQMEAPTQVGTFDNPPPDSPEGDHIDNVDGAQAAFVFAGMLVGMFQELVGSPFEIGQAYTLTIGLAGSAETLTAGSNFELLLYYRDALNNKVPIALNAVSFDPNLDPGKINHLYDYSVSTPIVQASDAWAGKDIGIELRTNSAPGGYWDVDNVRLNAVPEPASCGLLALGAAVFGLRRGGRHRR